MDKNLKQIINDFTEEMSESAETGEELQNKIKKENKGLIKNIINYFMDKFNFLNKSES